MKSRYIFFLLALLPAFNCLAQFRKDVEQAYILYNRARLYEAKGQLDSAADNMKRSIRLNRENGLTRDYAQAIYLKSGRYNDFIEDINDYYAKNTLPEDMDGLFLFINDSAAVARAKNSTEIKKFAASYEDYKKINRRTVKGDNELKQILDNCDAIDQFVRPEMDWKTKDDSNFFVRLIRYGDSINMEAVASYIKMNGFPSSVEFDELTLNRKFVTPLLHFLRYTEWPVCKYIDSSVRQAIYNGIFPARFYVVCLDNKSYTISTEHKQQYGTATSGTIDQITKKGIRVLDPEIDDIEHVDERRRKWLLLTLYEESLIDPALRLPENYRPK